MHNMHHFTPQYKTYKKCSYHEETAQHSVSTDNFTKLTLYGG